MKFIKLKKKTSIFVGQNQNNFKSSSSFFFFFLFHLFAAITMRSNPRKIDWNNSYPYESEIYMDVYKALFSKVVFIIVIELLYGIVEKEVIVEEAFGFFPPASMH